jgi:hypothetical protein
MKAELSMLDNHQKKFMSILEKIDKSRRLGEIFGDWVIMMSASLYSWKRNIEIENEYIRRAKKYSKEQINLFAELLVCITEALDEEIYDFLGQIFLNLGLANKQLSQFFTPSQVSDMMVRINIGDDILASGRVISIYDGCCGSGGILISAIKCLEEKDKNFRERVYFVAQDIDSICAHIVFVQLSILKIPAIVNCGNTLKDEVIWSRETIWWHINKIDDKLSKQKKEDSSKHETKQLGLIPV